YHKGALLSQLCHCRQSRRTRCRRAWYGPRYTARLLRAKSSSGTETRRKEGRCAWLAARAHKAREAKASGKSAYCDWIRSHAATAHLQRLFASACTGAEVRAVWCHLKRVASFCPVVEIVEIPDDRDLADGETRPKAHRSLSYSMNTAC